MSSDMRTAALRRPSPLSRASRVVAILLILAGGLALVDGAITLLWQEPLTALYAHFKQDDLRGELRAVEQRTPSAQVTQAVDAISGERRRIAFLAGDFARHSKPGDPIGRIVIPHINADFVIVDGTGTDELKSGPGLMRETRFPGVAGTTTIAGHRTTYLAPFRHIDSLYPGTHIVLYMPYAKFTYTVIAQRVVAPTDVRAAVNGVGYSRLVLSACTPLFSAAKRLLVYARLTRTVPEGNARLLLGGAVAKPLEAKAAPKPPKLKPMLKSLNPNQVAPVS
jgi:sortase A